MDPNLQHNIREIRISYRKFGLLITIYVNTTCWKPCEFKYQFNKIFITDNINPSGCTFEICKIKCSGKGEKKVFDNIWMNIELDGIYDEIESLESSDSTHDSAYDSAYDSASDEKIKKKNNCVIF